MTTQLKEKHVPYMMGQHFGWVSHSLPSKECETLVVRNFKAFE
jgi:hypothetical protein